MVEVNAAWLAKLGVKTSDESEMEALVVRAMDELELRVGSKIADKLTAEQITEFERIGDDDERVAWLGKAFPSYDDTVYAEYDAMAKEIADNKDKVALIYSWV